MQTHATRAGATRASPIPHRASRRLRRATVLVVDDDPCMRDLLRLHLRNAGYTVLTAEDAIVAGRLVLQCAPHLMIVDVNMPYMNGLEFVAAVRADATLPAIPVIFLSAEEEGEACSDELGAAYPETPVRAARLLAVVAQRLSVAAA